MPERTQLIQGDHTTGIDADREHLYSAGIRSTTGIGKVAGTPDHLTILKEQVHVIAGGDVHQTRIHASTFHTQGITAAAASSTRAIGSVIWNIDKLTGKACTGINGEVGFVNDQRWRTT